MLNNFNVSNRLDFLDFAKGFAILAIVIFHYLIPFSTGLQAKIIMAGGAGVHLFILLSGFGLSLTSKKITIQQYYKRRFIKILIPYYIVVTFIFIINNFLIIYNYDNNFYAYMGHILLFKMFDSSIMGSFGDHFWFISTIIQFYLIYPFLVFFRQKLTRQKFIVLSILISIIYWVFLTTFELSEKRIFNSIFMNYLWEFNLGIIFAEMYKNDELIFWNRKLSFYFYLAISSFFVKFMMTFLPNGFSSAFNDIPSLLGITSLTCISYLLFRKIKCVFNFFMIIGKFSYELYLIHMVVFQILFSLILNEIYTKHPLIFTLISLFLSIIIASYYSVFNNKLLNNFTKI